MPVSAGGIGKAGSRAKAKAPRQHAEECWSEAARHCRKAWEADPEKSIRECAVALGIIKVHFRNPSMPSVVTQSDAMVKQISAIPWLAESDVALRELGYDDEQITQLRSDRMRSEATQLMGRVEQ